jgi:cell division protein FtsW (lipid II flippase)
MLSFKKLDTSQGVTRSMHIAIRKNNRWKELSLGIIINIILISGLTLLSLAKNATVPKSLWPTALLVGLLYMVGHLAIRLFAPLADPTLFPLGGFLTTVGFICISRLDPEQAQAQALWILVALTAFCATLGVIQKTITLENYRYLSLIGAVTALLLPLTPGIGREIYGSRLWINIGGFTIQPGELAKILLIIFLASYLSDRKELLSAANKKLRLKDVAPLVFALSLSIIIMVLEKDLGSSLLFYSLFLCLIYVASKRISFVIIGLAAFGIAAYVSYKIFGHVEVRVTTWLDPWADPQGDGYQLIQSWFAFANGGVSGTGLGLGTPNLIPKVSTDFIFAAIAEELGLAGSIAVLIALLLICTVAFRIALNASKDFSKLLATGCGAILAIQSFIIIGGILRIIPLTGLTIPFVSYGGSSLLANFIILAILLRISDEETRLKLMYLSAARR